jgi:hypothetical protein
VTEVDRELGRLMLGSSVLTKEIVHDSLVEVDRAALAVFLRLFRCQALHEVVHMLRRGRSRNKQSTLDLVGIGKTVLAFSGAHSRAEALGDLHDVLAAVQVTVVARESGLSFLLGLHLLLAVGGQFLALRRTETALGLDELDVLGVGSVVVVGLHG